MKPYELLIFDWDGTLSDSAQLIASTMQQAITGLNLPPRSDQQIRELIGLGLADGMGRLYPEMDTPGLLVLLDNFRRNWLASGGAGPAEAPLFQGADTSLQVLHEQGYLLAVATGKSRAGLNRSLRLHAGIKPMFITTKTADETANKPDPLMLTEILAELGLPPERALMIGDTEYDAEMAGVIGMPMLGVGCGVHDAGRILAAGAMATIATVAELPAWLARPG